jgi:CheY-like chemotaxis protein
MAACTRAILIVEDCADDARSLQDVLARAGIQNPIEVVHSVPEAVKRLTDVEHGNGSPAVILLDLKLPGRNGFQFLEWLREHAEFNNILTVVISGLGDLASIRRAYALGADSFLTKPCGFLDVKNLVEWFPDYWNRIVPALPRTDSKPTLAR